MHSTHHLRRLTAAVAVVAAVALSIAGCSTASSGGATKISLSMQNPNVKTADPATWAIVQAFEKKNPNITVTVTGQAVAQHLQNLSVAAQSHTLPDIFWIYKATAEQMNKSGYLMDLAPMLKELGLTDKISSSTLDNFSTGKVTYGVPYQGLLTGIWYNKKILSDNGLTVPKTFDEFLHVAETLHAKGITTLSDGANQSSFSVWSFLVDLDRYGWESKYQAILAGKASYDNPDFVRFYDSIAKLREAGAFPSNVTTQTYQQAVNEFTSGKAAMLDAGIWASSAIQDSTVAPDAGFWAGPTFSDGVGKQDIVMNVASAPFAVSADVKKDSAKSAAVKKFIAFYYSDAAQQLLVDNGQPPVTNYTPKLDATKQSVLKGALEASTAPGLTSPQTQPDLVVSTAVASAMYDSIYGVIEGQLTSKQAVDLVQKAIDAGK
jgi:raffinose/stachyose/melibiose transport system substrate-binding protein